MSTGNVFSSEAPYSVMQKVLLKRRRTLILPALTKEDDYHSSLVTYEVFDPDIVALITSFVENIAVMGYRLSEECFKYLASASHGWVYKLKPILASAQNYLKELRGGDREYRMMYPQFPHQVMEMSNDELFINAILHYWTNGTFMPEESTRLRTIYVPADIHYDELEVIQMTTTPNDYLDIIENLFTANTSLSEDDKKDLDEYMQIVDLSLTVLPEIPYKENLAAVAGMYLKYAKEFRVSAIKNWFKTATDVLRFYAAISDADVSLAKPPKFRSLSYRERRLLMNLLASVGNLEEDMWRYPEYWKRAGERIHPGKFKKDKYTKVNEAFNAIRSKKKHISFAGKVEANLLHGDYKKAIDRLTTRPGELVRRLDHLARLTMNNPEEYNYLINALGTVVDDVEVPVLLQAWNHFCSRQEETNLPRIFFPKSSTGQKTYVKEETLPELPLKIVQGITSKLYLAILSHFAKKEFLGAVYIDPAVEKVIIPNAQRSASSMSKIITRGSRVPMKKDMKYFRPYIWWTNMKDGTRVDLDLSVVVFNENLERLTSVSYMNLRNMEYGIVHSGDITNGGDYTGPGVAEFIDCNIEKCKKQGARYLMMTIHLYSGGPKISDIGNVSAGYMELREDDVDMRGHTSRYNNDTIREVFQIQNVALDFTVTTEATVATPVIIDLETNELIWVDLAGDPTNALYHFVGNNVHSSAEALVYNLKATMFSDKIKLFDLITMHADARGMLVYNKDDADVVFSFEQEPEGDYRLIRPYDVDVLMSEFLS